MFFYILFLLPIDKSPKMWYCYSRKINKCFQKGKKIMLHHVDTYKSTALIRKPMQLGRGYDFTCSEEISETCF